MRSASPWLAAAGAAALLAWGNPQARMPDPERFWGKRPAAYWEENHLASAYYVHGQFPASMTWPDAVRTERHHFFNGELYLAGVRSGIEPWQFWRTLEMRRFRRQTNVNVAERFNDAGRPMLLALGFGLLGGIAPILIHWLAWILALPILLWLAWEFRSAGRQWAGAAFLLFLGSSAYLADLLALGYSAVGFYALGLLALAALAVYAELGRSRSTLGLAVRLLAAGLAFAVCASARSSALFSLPAFAWAAWRAIGRVLGQQADQPRRRALAALGGLLLLLPYAATALGIDRVVRGTLARHPGAVTGPRHHSVWNALWEGLGDFDRLKGFAWDDGVASDYLVKAGGARLGAGSYYGPGNDALFRAKVLREIRNDPSWYAGILLRRFLATLSQRKLWAWEPLSGSSFYPRTDPAEGQIDGYYRQTATADVFGLGGSRFDLPMPLLVLPTLGLIGATVLGGTEARRLSAVLATLALGALPLPVLITTAGGLETQAFLLVYLMGGAFALEQAFSARSRSSS